VEHLSVGMTLEPGDVLFTGTPGGVGAAMDPRQFLKAGDTMRCEIDGLGHIEATMVAEA
jgi:2-keto-4-pentenoate hydratase/2-oxohepta-3-ene-1,7-dioic acid hydratase in catechol pathway